MSLSQAEITAKEIELAGESLMKKAVKRLLKKRAAMVGLVIVLIAIFVAVFAPWVAPHDPSFQNPRNANQPPSAEYRLGTDHLGRCVLSRIIFGSRISLSVGLVVTFFRALIGIPLGLIAGYSGGRIDSVIMRISDTFIAFPGILLAISIMAIFGPGLNNVILALSIVGWPQYTRLVRGQTLSLKEIEFIEASRALGMRVSRIMTRHLLPNMLSTLIVYTTLGLATPIVAEASLSFLGLGVQPPTVSWGRMLSEGRRFLRFAPWTTTYTGIVITITVLGYNLLGDGLRDALDPRLKD